MKHKNDHIFLSYSRKDQWEFRALYNELRLSGFRVWVDKELSPGTPDWEADLFEALSYSACLVCICSPNSIDSTWVMNELQKAIELNVLIYPVVVAGESMEKAIPSSISKIQAIDCRNDYTISISKLLAKIISNHQDAQTTDLRTILSSEGIYWTRFGSLFWFASEVRKLRLLIRPEQFAPDRMRDSLIQLQHHATKLNVDKYTLRDIEHVQLAFKEFEGNLTEKQMNDLENKLRHIQDNIALKAEKLDPSFEGGPRAGRPISI
jgi:hypothetical protein